MYGAQLLIILKLICIKSFHLHREIQRLYNVKQNPEVQNGKKTEQEAFIEYINSFEPDFINREENVKDGQVCTNFKFLAVLNVTIEFRQTPKGNKNVVIIQYDLM